MSEDRIDRAPRRLKHEAGHLARLLSRAEAEFRGDLDEASAFQKIEAVRRRRAFRGVAAAGSLVLATAAVLMATQHREVSHIQLQAEVLPKSSAPPKAQNIAASPSVPLALEEPPTVTRVVPTPSTSAGAAPPSEEDCRRWSTSGKNERAMECFRVLSRTASGVQGEVALYEAARIAGERLHEPTRALALLDEHAARFPVSALRAEVRWLKIKSLAQAARYDAALSESETLLGSPEGRALSGELHLLRGRIYQDQQKNCDRALSEFVGLVGEPGMSGDDAEFRRASCLEALGRVEDAMTAYSRYLERSNVARASEARARLAALRP